MYKGVWFEGGGGFNFLILSHFHRIFKKRGQSMGGVKMNALHPLDLPLISRY